MKQACSIIFFTGDDLQDVQTVIGQERYNGMSKNIYCRAEKVFIKKIKTELEALIAPSEPHVMDKYEVQAIKDELELFKNADNYSDILEDGYYEFQGLKFYLTWSSKVVDTKPKKKK